MGDMVGDERAAALEEISNKAKNWKFSTRRKEVVMAKKELKSQQTIDGAVDRPSHKVHDAARKYAKTLYQRMQLQKDEEVLKPALDKVMEAESVTKLEVTFGVGERDETIRYEVKRGEVAATSKITCKKIGGDSE